MKQLHQKHYQHQNNKSSIFMLNIGLSELVIIIFVGLIFLTPQDMIKIVKYIRKLNQQVISIFANSKSYVNNMFTLEDDMVTIKQQTKQLSDTISEHCIIDNGIKPHIVLIEEGDNTEYKSKENN